MRVSGSITIKINLEAESHSRLGIFTDDIVKSIMENPYVKGASVRRDPMARHFIEVEQDMTLSRK